MSDPIAPSTDSPVPPAPEPARQQSVFESSSLIFVFLRVCLYLVLAFGISVALQFLSRSAFRGHRSSFAPRALFIGEFIGFAGIFLAAYVMARLEKRGFATYGLPLRSAFGKLFWQGALLGFIEISAVVGVLAAFGAYHFGAIAIHGAELVRWALFWAVFFILVGLYEEFQFRGYLQFTISQAIGFWPAAALLSVAFGLVHIQNEGENWLGVAGVMLTGLLWCFALRRTGNLWLPIGMHAAFDFGETFLYSVPDSGYVFPGHLSSATISGPAWLTGGSVGPEASPVDFLMLTLFFFIIHRLYPAKPRLPELGNSAPSF
jgi:uncharacterized protein